MITQVCWFVCLFTCLLARCDLSECICPIFMKIGIDVLHEKVKADLLAERSGDQQTDRQTDRQTNKQINKQTEIQTERQTCNGCV